MPDSEEEVTIVDGVTVRYSTRGIKEEMTREDGSIAEGIVWNISTFVY